MNEHTPGPWEAENTNSGIMIKSTRKPGYLAAARWFTQSSKEIWANAYLIAAAPDLLGACEAALEIIGVYDEGVGLTLEERMLERTILVAIAKARGGDR